MIRFHLKKLISDWEFSKGRRLTFDELSQSTGIHRTTLSRIANLKGYNTTTDNIDVICRFFGCEVGQVMEYLADD
ncbi:helix-turn-helix domain-containing protein [Desulfuromonas thiophila]|uniref:Putative transcriptional regulator n=1 Tax=Desulfuromonas thiophila TaxID=57664 RepID=A0A1G7B9X6_9BACT|nr:helix-turn-helix transcriptional regulator [Desulfuromonas thiophila]SDE23620.1 putative transcriptional regulator [Desulfuromonas thiophila]